MAEDIGDVSVDVITDFSGFEAQLRRVLEKLERQLDLNVPVDVNTARASARMRVWRRLQERAIDIQIRITERSLAKAAGQIAALSGISTLTKAFQDFNDHIKDFFTNIIPISMRLGKLAAAAGPAATLVGSLAIGLQNVARVAGKGAMAGLIALPGLLVAAGAGAFTFMAAFQDAPEVLGNSLTQYQKLQKTVSDNFWAKAAQPMKDLLNNVFPAINQGFATLATSAGNFTGRLSNELQKVFTPERIEGIFGNWSRGFDILAEKAAGPLASITGNLVEWGSTLIPKIADKFSDMLITFDAWLDKAIKTGELDKALDNFFQMLKDIWNILKDTWSIFDSIATAAKNAGIGAFPLVTIMDDIANTMKSPEFQTGLTTFFDGARRGFEGMKAMWEPFKGAVATFTPIISEFIAVSGQQFGEFMGKIFTAMQDPKFVANIQSMFDSFGKVFENLGPAVQPFMDKLGEIGKLAGIVADVMSKTLGIAIQELAPVFGTLLEKMGPLVEEIGKFIQTTLQNADWEKIGSALGNLVDAATGFVEALNSPVIRFIIDLILDFIVTAVSGFINLASGVQNVVNGIMKLLSGDFSGLEDIWKGLGQALEGLWQLFLTLFAPAKILKFLAPIGKFLVDAIGPALKGIGDLLGPAFSGIGKFFGEVFGNIPGLIGKLFTELGPNILKWAGDMGKFLIDGLVNGAKALIGGFLVNVWEPIVEGFKSFFGIASPSTLFMQFGQWVIEGLINGIKMLIDGVIALFTPVIEGIKLAWQGLVDFFTMLWNGIIAILTPVVEGIRMAWDGLVQFLTGLWNGFVAILTGIWNTILSVASVVWNGILAVVQTVWNAILAVATTVWNAIVAGFNFLLSVATTVWNAILSVAQVVWGAIQAAFEVVSSVIQAGFQVIQSVAETVWNAIQAVVQTVISTIQSIIEGLSSFVSNIFNGFIAFAQSAWDGILAGAQGLVSGIQGVLGGIGDIVAGIFNGIKGTIEGIWNSIQLPNILGGLGIPGFATGVNNFGGGLAVVGENGPELVRLPKGSDVFTAGRTRSIMAASHDVAPDPGLSQPAQNAGFTFAPTIYNPEKETTEESLFKSAQTLSYLGLTG